MNLFQERLRRERNREYNEMLKRRNEANNKLKYKQQKAQHTKTEATKVYLPQTNEDIKEKVRNQRKKVFPNYFL